MQNLQQRFEAAHLLVLVSPTPIIRAFIQGADAIVQMDIAHDKRGREHFRLYCGASDNVVIVTGIDPDERQLVLHVHEPKRKFLVRQWNSQRRKFEMVERVTDPFRRTYLMGHDETALFIAELPKSVTTVAQAHACLQPMEVQSRLRVGKVKRQGEWFFLPVTTTEEQQITEMLLLQPIERKIQLGRSRNPHIAEFKLGDFVKGHITHPQHHSVKLVGWHRAVRNTESERTLRNDPRLGWID